MPASRTRTVFHCQSCGATAPKWAGRCEGCGEWNTLEEAPAAARSSGARPAAVTAPASPIGEVALHGFEPLRYESAPAPGVMNRMRDWARGLLP